jgi:hypothetical protein
MQNKYMGHGDFSFINLPPKLNKIKVLYSQLKEKGNKKELKNKIA